MKLSLIACALGLATAYDIPELNPKRRPRSMKSLHRARWVDNGDGPVGTFVGNYEGIAAEDVKGTCIKQMKAFDSYCHQYAIPNDSDRAPRYGDYTDLEVGEVGDGSQCDQWDKPTEKFYCLAQDCMFEYCLWRRDTYIEGACLIIAENWLEAVAESGQNCQREDD